MGLFSKLFGKKKKSAEIKGFFDLYEDGQSQYFKKEGEGAGQTAEPVAEPAAPASASTKADSKAKPVAKAKSEKKEDSAKPKAQKKTAAKPQKPEEEKPLASLEESSDNASEASAKKTGRFEIKKSKDGRFVFNLYAPNSVIVATSQVYTSAASAINGIESIIANAKKASLEDQSTKKSEPKNCPKWEIYIDNAGQYRFRLNAPNGNCIVHSQGYTTKSACKNGIDSIIRCSVNPEIDKSYLKK